jgi:hypothetical protein
MAEVKKQARPIFDEKVAPALRQMGAPDSWEIRADMNRLNFSNLFLVGSTTISV